MSVCVQVSSAIVFVVKCRATVQVLKHIVNTQGGLTAERGVEEKGLGVEHSRSGEQVPLEDLFNHHTSPSLSLSLSLSLARSLSIWIMLIFKNLIYSIH